jgi:hypothetical protein
MTTETLTSRAKAQLKILMVISKYLGSDFVIYYG